MGAEFPANKGQVSKPRADSSSPRSLISALRLRAAILTTIRRFFTGREYLEVDTPSLVPSPGLDLHLDAFAIEGKLAGRPAFLSTSPEYQMKRLLGLGLPRIFQLARCFRRGECGQRHNPEFLMVEWYQAHCDYRALMDETELLVRQVVQAHAPSLTIKQHGQSVDLAVPFESISVCDAFARFAEVDRQSCLRLARNDEEQFFRILIERIEPALAGIGHAVFLFDYPASQASLARRKTDDPELCERFELYVGDLELCNGFGELVDPIEQRTRLEEDQSRRTALGKPVYPIDEQFLAALDAGLPPAAGNALGVDRLVALCAGATDIGDVMPFPNRRL